MKVFTSEVEAWQDRARVAETERDALKASNAALVEARDEIEKQHSQIGAVDGYDYRSGEEYGFRCALIILDNAIAQHAGDQQ